MQMWEQSDEKDKSEEGLHEAMKLNSSKLKEKTVLRESSPIKQNA